MYLKGTQARIGALPYWHKTPMCVPISYTWFDFLLTYHFDKSREDSRKETSMVSQCGNTYFDRLYLCFRSLSALMKKLLVKSGWNSLFIHKMPNVIPLIFNAFKIFSVSCLNLEVSLDFVVFSLLAKNIAKLGWKHQFFSIGWVYMYENRFKLLRLTTLITASL